MGLHPDFVDLLAAFAAEDVRYLLVGGYAVAFHGKPRFTKDLDLWIDAGPANLERAARALVVFGAPQNVVDALGTAGLDEIVYMGAPPVRVDVFKSLPGVDFEACYTRRVDERWEDVPVSVIGIDDLIAAKRATARAQDLVDVALLEEIRKR